MKVEICIDADGDIRHDVRAAVDGGASSIELCGSMFVQGLTPTFDQIRRAAECIKSAQLVVMLRDRSDTFAADEDETRRWIDLIPKLGECGATGISFGLLDRLGNVDRPNCVRIVDAARSVGLATTFHRAFDAAQDTDHALKKIIEIGCDRVLTSGTPWGAGLGAFEGLERIRRTVSLSNNRIETVVAGGISKETVNPIRAAVAGLDGRVSVHAYSNVLVDGRVSTDAVARLVQAASL